MERCGCARYRRVMMRRLMFVLVSAALLSACGSTPAPPPVTVTVTTTATVVVTPTGVPVGTLAMPPLVGLGLQDAQDQLQSLGSFVLNQEDASGQGRHQLIDSNWKVCSQDPAAGSLISVTSSVTLRAVKNEETCP